MLAHETTFQCSCWSFMLFVRAFMYGYNVIVKFRLYQKTLVNVVSPLELRVEIPSEIPKPLVTTDGNQTATDLTPYPRLRQTGMGSQTVGLCGVDMVCQYDLELSISSVQYM